LGNSGENVTKKRKSGGRKKGSKGRGKMVQCMGCGKLVPRDKAARQTKTVRWIDSRLAEELMKQGAYLPQSRSCNYYCVRCAVHRGITPPRAKEKRKEVDKIEVPKVWVKKRN